MAHRPVAGRLGRAEILWFTEGMWREERSGVAEARGDRAPLRPTKAGRKSPEKSAAPRTSAGQGPGSGGLDQVGAGEDLAVGELAAPPGEHLASGLGDDDGVLELGGESAVGGEDRPLVGKDL